MERVEVGIRSGVKIMSSIDIGNMFAGPEYRRYLKAKAMKKELAELRVKNEQLKAEDRKLRWENARLASIIGAALIEICVKQPDSVGVMVRQVLQASKLREEDRGFLSSRGWL
jgi:hypothetical protein